MLALNGTFQIITMYCITSPYDCPWCVLNATYALSWSKASRIQSHSSITGKQIVRADIKYRTSLRIFHLKLAKSFLNTSEWVLVDCYWKCLLIDTGRDGCHAANYFDWIEA